ncbi:exodeoxyribonuclease VII large subunit [Pelobacter seleniigenes]|uniref:exodeoxyribonuclease VII large subunit n=1 Tax=Pelobacter seleniigenes TaxID=407188 RepID=UPI0004A726AF|nr:exodeoxyribonuclease VII large subunit [Pelobacter seleniigenes]
MDKSTIVPVSALVELLRELVEDNFVNVLVKGELSNFSRPSSGHCYFTLKDDRAQLRCAMFRSHARTLAFQPEEGMAVICRGRVSVYPQRGDLQLIIEEMLPEGIGSLQLAFEQLKEKLQKEGLFATERKRPLPAFPARIGIVTSPTGAAIRDILNVLKRRSAGLTVLLRPVRVQGDGAAAEIAAAIADLNQEGSSDVLIVGRGGGSREDLWAFNEEVVARALAASKIPVISAVGHEVDFSIADMVADLRAPTPSAAAELVVQNRLELERHLDQLTMRLAGQMKSRIALLESRLSGLKKRLRAPLDLLRMQALRQKQASERLVQAMERKLLLHDNELSSLCAKLNALSPLAVLGRGYAIVRHPRTDSIVVNAAQVTAGDSLQIMLAQGRIEAQVTATADQEEE